MKGFIEVFVNKMTYFNQRVVKNENDYVLININEIVAVAGCHLTLRVNDIVWDLSCRETHEEIKKKIEQAQGVK